MHMAHLSGNTGVSKSSSDWLNYTGFPGDVCVVFFNVPPGNKYAVPPNLLTKEESRAFTNVTTSAYQDQLNAGFSKVCEIFKVRGIESLKYVREFHTPVWYCGDISTHRNVMLNETNCDWLFDMSVKRPHGRGGPWPINAAIYSRPSAVSLKVWLRETNSNMTYWSGCQLS